MTEADCSTSGGDYQGPGTDCASFDCTLGACCFGDGSCQDLTIDTCANAGGWFNRIEVAVTEIT